MNMQAKDIIASSIKLLGVIGLLAGLALNPVTIARFLTPDGDIDSIRTLFGIITFEIILVGAGAYCMVNARTLSKKIITFRKELALSFAVFLVALVFLDQLMRLVLPPTYSVSEFGWMRQPESVVRKSVKDSPGQIRQIVSTVEENGFKRWGDVDSTGKKVLIVGDSFTEMTYVSNGEEWYAYLEEAYPDIDFFVFGAGGYGTLQEYLVLDTFIDRIDPDVVIWQFCDNDYGDNLYEWDIARYPHNSFSYRPYLENGEVVYRLPVPYAGVRSKSRIADYLLRTYDNQLQYHARKRYFANKESEPPPAISAEIEARALEVTRTILSMVRDRTVDRDVFLFSAQEIGPKEMELCAGTGIRCIPGVDAHVQSAAAEGLAVTVVDDGHWNTVGNRLAGEFLAEYFRRANAFR